jgi:excisionase family DNA binding protein
MRQAKQTWVCLYGTAMKNGQIAVSVPEEVIERVAKRAAELLQDEMSETPERFVGVPEAAEHLGCRPHRIYDLVHQRLIPFHKEGSRLLFRRSELTDWVEHRRRPRSLQPGTRPAGDE